MLKETCGLELLPGIFETCLSGDGGILVRFSGSPTEFKTVDDVGKEVLAR